MGSLTPWPEMASQDRIWMSADAAGNIWRGGADWQGPEPAEPSLHHPARNLKIRVRPRSYGTNVRANARPILGKIVGDPALGLMTNFPDSCGRPPTELPLPQDVPRLGLHTASRLKETCCRSRPKRQPNPIDEIPSLCPPRLWHGCKRRAHDRLA